MPRQKITLPDLGFHDRAISLGLWLVRLQGWVVRGQPLVEVLCGSVLVDLPSPLEGRLVEKKVETDSPISVGQELGVIESPDHLHKK